MPACQCKVKDKANWRVMKRNYQCSAFNGYKREWTARSAVICLKCPHIWRTAAKYVSDLKDWDPDELSDFSEYNRAYRR